jgi:hypothetical protein
MAVCTFSSLARKSAVCGSSRFSPQITNAGDGEVGYDRAAGECPMDNVHCRLERDWLMIWLSSRITELA